MNSLGTYEDISVALPFLQPRISRGLEIVVTAAKDASSSVIFAVCNALFLAQS